MTAEGIRATLARLLAARAMLVRRPHAEILAAVERVVESWLVADSPWANHAALMRSERTGFSPEMIHAALPTMIQPLRNLRDLLIREVAEPENVDRVLARRAPHLIAHVSAGNLVGAAAIPVALSLALRAATLVKVASGDRVFPELFRQSIAEVDPQLAACVAVCEWTGGDRTIEAAVFDAADLVIASGSDATIDDVRSRCRSSFLGFGHRVSFAFLSREVSRSAVALDRAAAALAHDVSLWDQRGCLSPQLCFVEGSFEDACRFAESLGGELAREAIRLPAGPLSLAEQVELRRFRDEAEVRQLAGEAIRLLASTEVFDWTIVVEGAARFLGTPLHRSMRVAAVSGFDEVERLLGPHRRWLEACGVAAEPEVGAALAHRLEAAGVHRVCRLGEMQRPPLDWRQGGLPRLAAWLTMDRADVAR